MSIKVGKLKEILERYDDSMEIILVTKDLPWKPLKEVALGKVSTIKNSISVVEFK